MQSEDVRPLLRRLRFGRENTGAALALTDLAVKLIKAGSADEAVVALERVAEQLTALDNRLAQEEEAAWTRQRTVAKLLEKKKA